MDDKKALTYAEAGVDVEAGSLAVALMKEKVQATYRPEVVGDLGGFAGMFRIPNLQGFTDPVLLSGADGVGTKIQIAIEANVHHTVGQDLVAMCVNDILVLGGEPLFFLDYIACNHVDPQQIATIVGGIASACASVGCALIGGETAEHGDVMPKGDYDLGGFAVGIADLPKIIDGKTIAPGDVILGLPSSGVHSNGFSLTRRIVANAGLKTSDPAPWQPSTTVGEALLTPTTLYVNPIMKLLRHVAPGTVKGMVHITGGGFLENVNRVLPEGCKAEIKLGTWPRHSVFAWLQEQGNVSTEEMYRTYNNGIGFMLVVSPSDLEQVEAELEGMHQEYFRIGSIAALIASDAHSVQLV